MKLAVSMWSYVADWRTGGFSIADFIRAAAMSGADGVELLDFFYRDPSDPWNSASATPSRIEDGRREAKLALEESGMPVPIFSVANNFAQPEPEHRRAALESILFGIEEAQRYGARTVRVFAGDTRPDLTLEQARSWIVEGLAEASRAAASAGIRLALENHGRLAGRGEQVVDLIRDVREMAGNDALGANPDTGNFLLVDEPDFVAPQLAIAQVAHLANMVHLKDFARAGGEETAPYSSMAGVPYAGRAVGEGDVDLAACLRGLKEAGFDGWLSIEYEGAEAAGAAIPRSIEAARELMAS